MDRSKSSGKSPRRSSASLSTESDQGQPAQSPASVIRESYRDAKETSSAAMTTQLPSLQSGANPKALAADSIESRALVDGHPIPEDETLDTGAQTLRPATFADYLGQQQLKENLSVYVQSALQRTAQLDHVILHGPPGLGKTTMARILAAELGAPLFETRGPAIDRQGDLAGILSGLQPGCLLFIDEIHRLSIKIEEILYSAMDEFRMDIIMGEGPGARAVQIPVAPFTLVGATTRLSLLSKPLRDRFGIQERLAFYDDNSLADIVKRSAAILKIKLTTDGAIEIAERSRGTPRIANRLLRRVWDFALGYGHSQINQEVAADVLLRQGIDKGGLDRVDRQLLRTVQTQYSGGPVGIEALAATLNEDRATLEEVYEPYLVYKGYLARGPRGRLLTNRGIQHLETTSVYKD